MTTCSIIYRLVPSPSRFENRQWCKLERTIATLEFTLIRNKTEKPEPDKIARADNILQIHGEGAQGWEHQDRLNRPLNPPHD